MLLQQEIKIEVFQSFLLLFKPQDRMKIGPFCLISITPYIFTIVFVKKGFLAFKREYI
ncbi:hypothetical protein JOC77_001418 [Peribacillus deserti]|uniref:ABC transporter permease n=1 Tax=Peribacillus deserti TaxID=673318 RepID=A0ABS2QFT1_9BACI|nr:hypothetical protein [Peribacillus deserti]